MPPPPTAPAPGPHRRRPTHAWALPLSIALHVLIVYAVGRVSWVAPEIENERAPAIVWLEEWPVTDVEPSPERTEQAEPTEPAEPAEPALAEPPEPDTQEPEESAAEEDPPPEPVAESPPSPTGPPAEARGEASEEGSTDAPIDWEDTRRQVIERMREQRALDEGYRTFSLDDWVEEPLPVEPGPETPIFERCPVVTSRGRQLMMGLLGLCFRTQARDDLFAHIKRDYMKARPVCEPVVDGAGNEVYKCRLVVEEE